MHILHPDPILQKKQILIILLKFLQIEMLLLPLKNSLSQMDDANYDVGVVSLIANCIHLSSQPGMLPTNVVSILLTTTTTTTIH